MEHHHDGSQESQNVDAAKCRFELSHAVLSVWPPERTLKSAAALHNKRLQRKTYWLIRR